MVAADDSQAKLKNFQGLDWVVGKPGKSVTNFGKISRAKWVILLAIQVPFLFIAKAGAWGSLFKNEKAGAQDTA
jgi:hypothetical protein